MFSSPLSNYLLSFSLLGHFPPFSLQILQAPCLFVNTLSFISNVTYNFVDSFFFIIYPLLTFIPITVLTPFIFYSLPLNMFCNLQKKERHKKILLDKLNSIFPSFKILNLQNKTMLESPRTRTPLPPPIGPPKRILSPLPTTPLFPTCPLLKPCSYQI